ncbi:hypothetical protein BU15DRAFT_83757 [Melanogaster broomeanus]|nr:hypothetical protein BU15DRAFT_83757 [Melanogaster broomeanus]
MAPYFPDETGFQNILEYLGLRFEFIRRATVADTIDPGRCQRNMPAEVALATRVITTAMMRGWNNLEIPHTIRMLVDPQHTVPAHVNRPYLDVEDDPGLPYQWWSEADNNLPECYQELGWDVLLHLYNKFVTRFPTLVHTPKADTQQLTQIEQLEEARRHAVITRGLLQAESNKVEGELRLAMERIVQLEEHWSPGDIFDAIKSSEDNGRYRWPFM